MHNAFLISNSTFLFPYSWAEDMLCGARGDAGSNRTGGGAAVEDLGAFARAGVTTFDTADHYGPSEQLIGDTLFGCFQEQLVFENEGPNKLCRYGGCCLRRGTNRRGGAVRGARFTPQLITVADFGERRRAALTLGGV